MIWTKSLASWKNKFTMTNVTVVIVMIATVTVWNSKMLPALLAVLKLHWTMTLSVTIVLTSYVLSVMKKLILTGLVTVMKTKIATAVAAAKVTTKNNLIGCLERAVSE